MNIDLLSPTPGLMPRSPSSASGEGGLRASSAGTPPVQATQPVAPSTGPARPAAGTPSSPAAGDELRKAIEDAQTELQMVRRDLSMDYDGETGRLVIKVIDGESGEVVRQIPPDEILAFIRHLSKVLDGREGGLIQEKA